MKGRRIPTAFSSTARKRVTFPETVPRNLLQKMVVMVVIEQW